MSDFPNVSFDPSNPDPRCACVLVLDTSGSMSGAPIEQLNQELVAFSQALQGDSVAQSRVEIAIVTFGPAQVTQDFTPAHSFHPPVLRADDGTPLGPALHLALDILRNSTKIQGCRITDHGCFNYRWSTRT